MILVVLGIGIVFMFLGLACTRTSDLEDFFAGIGGGVFIVALIALICISIPLSKARTYQEQIDICEEENAAIEAEIADMINNFVQHETDIIGNVTNDEAMKVITSYPELRSSDLVKSQIDIYTENRNHIIELRLKQTQTSVYKWWLYFGR